MMENIIKHLTMFLFFDKRTCNFNSLNNILYLAISFRSFSSYFPIFLSFPKVHVGMFTHDDIIKWKHLPRYWPFVRGIQRSPVNSPHKGQWRRALMFSLICTWNHNWANNGDAGNLRRYHVHYDVIVMYHACHIWFNSACSKCPVMVMKGLIWKESNIQDFIRLSTTCSIYVWN